MKRKKVLQALLELHHHLKKIRQLSKRIDNMTQTTNIASEVTQMHDELADLTQDIIPIWEPDSYQSQVENNDNQLIMRTKNESSEVLQQLKTELNITLETYKSLQKNHEQVSKLQATLFDQINVLKRMKTKLAVHKVAS